MTFVNSVSLYELVIGCIALINVAMTIAVLMSNRHKAAAAKLELMRTDMERSIDGLSTELRGAVSGHATRLERLDVHVTRMPSHGDLARIYTEVNAVRDKVSNVQGELRGINDNLRLITARLLDHD